MDGGVVIMRAVMALSGGMDSTSLLLNLLTRGYTVTCISYRYGQKHSIEIVRAKENIARFQSAGLPVSHSVVDLTSSMSVFHSALTSSEIEVPEGHYEEEQMKQTVVPNRNAIFASILYGLALSVSEREDLDVSIALGVHSGDHAIYPDCRPEFYNALQNAFEIGNWGSERIAFELPYIDGDKTSILRDCLESCESLGLDFDDVMRSTITSYAPDSEGRSNGRTGSDIERILAFHEIGRDDPVEYIEDWKSVLRHALNVQAEYGE